jgi:hypothetical protein
MDDEDDLKELLHGPWPSPAEELSGLYGAEWDIYRVLLPDGRHGNWIAEKREGSERIVAKNIELLGRRLRSRSGPEK